MTSIARQPASSLTRPASRATVDHIARSAIALLRRAQYSIRDAALATQLGPETETEIGRYTGARI